MKTQRHSYRVFLLLLLSSLTLFVLSGNVAYAQWAEQTVILNPGWNSVFLEVEPQNNSCDEVFQGIPVESVWMWNPDTSLVQYIQNPDELVPESPQWLTYFPPAHDLSFLTNLFAILGERVYLIKLTGTADVNWTIVGHPIPPKVVWTPNSLNLVGFHLAAGQEPTFSEFFSPSDAHNNDSPEAYRLNVAGEWEEVLNPQGTQMSAGEAYWIRCYGGSDYAGPLTVQAVSGRGLDFGRILVEQVLYVRNNTLDELDITFTPLDSLPGDPPAPPAGPVPLQQWIDPPAENAGWNPLTGIASASYGGREGQLTRFAITRVELPNTGVYQSLLEVKNAGMRILVPVSAAYEHDGYVGLWVGSAMINEVNQPASGDTTTPTASEFQFRLILHVDEGNQVRLLKEVTQMWKEPQGEQPGNYVLITDDELISNYSCPGLRDGRAVCRRVSSVAFSFETCNAEAPPVCLPQWDMAGSFGIGGTVSTPTDAPLVNDFSDARNPFKHQHHPDHDDPEEVYSVSRTIRMLFTSTDPTNLNMTIPGWGDTDMGGDYEEDISGLHKNTRYVKGLFRLHKVSNVGVLNDGQ